MGSKQSCASCKHAVFKGNEHYGECTIHWCLDGTVHPMVSKDWTCGADCKDYYCYEKLAVMIADHAAEVARLTGERDMLRAEADRLERDYNAASKCAETVIDERDAAVAQVERAEDQLATIHGLAYDAEVGACDKDWALEKIRKVAFGDTTQPHHGKDWRKRAERAEEVLHGLMIYTSDLQANAFPSAARQEMPHDHPLEIARAYFAAAQDAKTRTSLLDQLSTGPWPKFVEEVKAAAAERIVYRALEPGHGGPDCTACQHDSNTCDRAECPRWGGPEGEE